MTPHRMQCLDDQGQVVFAGLLVYAAGGFFGIACDDGIEREWPAELCLVEGA